MAPAPTQTALRELLADHQSRLSFALDSLFTFARERARRECADQLNQAVRRLRIAPDVEELSVTLLDAAAQFSTQAAIFRVEGETAKAGRVRGVPEPSAGNFMGLAISLNSAAALAGAVESRDPGTAVTTPAEVSTELCELFGHSAQGRVSIYPRVARDRVPA